MRRFSYISLIAGRMSIQSSLISLTLLVRLQPLQPSRDKPRDAKEAHNLCILIDAMCGSIPLSATILIPKNPEVDVVRGQNNPCGLITFSRIAQRQVLKKYSDGST